METSIPRHDILCNCHLIEVIVQYLTLRALGCIAACNKIFRQELSVELAAARRLLVEGGKGSTRRMGAAVERV